MGTLNVYVRMPDALQKESAQSDNSGLRKRPYCVKKFTFSGCHSNHQFLDVFSALSYPIELIPFALCHAS